MNVENGGGYISDCTFEANLAMDEAYGGGAVFLFESKSAHHFVNCVFKKNEGLMSGGALELEDVSHGVTFSGCVFESNIAPDGKGANIFDWDSGNTDVVFVFQEEACGGTYTGMNLNRVLRGSTCIDGFANSSYQGENVTAMTAGEVSFSTCDEGCEGCAPGFELVGEECVECTNAKPGEFYVYFGASCGVFTCPATAGDGVYSASSDRGLSACELCPAGCAACESSASCNTCKSGYYKDVSTCELCSTDCSTCDSADTCTTCKDGDELSDDFRCAAPTPTSTLPPQKNRTKSANSATAAGPILYVVIAGLASTEFLSQQWQ